MALTTDNQTFSKRTACPACESTSSATLFSCGFTESPLREYLTTHYRLESESLLTLKEGRYTLKECQRCELIYQEDVPGDRLSDEIYETWIEAPLALDTYLEEPLESYLYWLPEITDQSPTSAHPRHPCESLMLGWGGPGGASSRRGLGAASTVWRFLLRVWSTPGGLE